MPNVLLSAPYMLPFVERFEPVFEHYGLDVIIADVEERLEEDHLLAYAGQFDGAVCGDDRFTERVIEACLPRLKVISKWGTGIDSIDKEAATNHGVMVGNTPNAFTVPVADTVLGYMLAFARRQPWMDVQMKAGQWEKIPGRALSECTLGVIGVGNIGKAVLRRAQAFGMTLIGNDIIKIDQDFVDGLGIQMTSLDDLLARADFISLNCDLNPTSQHIINHDSLSLTQPHAVLINTARGPLVDETTLVEALQNKQLAGAALDVFEHEPLPDDSPLRTMDNVMLAPHNSNSSPTAWEAVHWNTIRNLLKGLDIPHEDLDPQMYPANKETTT
ncbi:MAG: dihydrofolate reductase [Chloroflexi bacterium]|nr:MAG: dihydrofolate reductase [Chloroflexota bacterium]MBL1194307.1 dihydrofolate reductase [Chloroflexota bacterium]NOH11597.1 phosphoglycerate dehydrogenase [Chloroflexota bacterium]